MNIVYDYVFYLNFDNLGKGYFLEVFGDEKDITFQVLASFTLLGLESVIIGIP
jgi:hypothetical protein